MGLSTEPNSVVRPAVRVTDQVPRLGANVRITPQARCYAIAELCRRAGVAGDFFRGCKISVGPAKTTVEICNGRSKFISFPHVSPEALKGLASGNVGFAAVPVTRKLSVPRRGTSSRCIVPFVSHQDSDSMPLFYLVDQDHLECAVDLPLSILLTLSRCEELLDASRDAHGRFPVHRSVASAGGFLDRPIVDECALAFEQALGLLLPSWKTMERKLRIKVSHDIDHVGIPFRFRKALRYAIRDRAPRHALREFSSWIGDAEPTELRSVWDIVRISNEHGVASTVYWKAAPPGPADSGYDPRDRKVRRVLEWLRKLGVECGVHPGYATFRSPEKLRREVSILREALGPQPLGGRQHYLRWCPDTWIDWENCGLAYDSSVGFADQIGFRAGTCIPYRPWIFSLNRQSDLLEIPLLVMDRTLIAKMKLEKKEALQAVGGLLARCQAVGGVFTLLWHNDSFLEPAYREIYLSLLEMLGGAENYDWQSDQAISSVS
jgi:hypothetical protein